MPQTLEFLRIFSKPLLLLVLPFFLVLLGTSNRPGARRVGLVCAGAMVVIACYPIAAITISTAVAMSEQAELKVTVSAASTGHVSGPITSSKQAGNAAPGSYPLRLSYYNPALGGINCDHDCSTMASGDKTAWWVGGQNGVYAAACPREWGWGHGTRFTVAGLDFECRDTGGWINCYTAGEYDPALKTNAGREYCWVDLMLSQPVAAYGTLTNDWGFE